MLRLKNIILFSIFVLFSFLSLVNNCYAGTYYVSPSGSANWNDCEDAAGTPGPKSDTSACSYISANQNAAAGDTVFYRTGTYTVAQTAIDPVNTGTPGNRIVFSSYNHEAVEFVSTSFGICRKPQLRLWNSPFVYNCKRYQIFQLQQTPLDSQRRI